MLELKANHLILRAEGAIQPGQIFFEPNADEEAYLIRVLAATPTGNEVEAEQEPAKVEAKTAAKAPAKQSKNKQPTEPAKDDGDAQVDDLVG